VIMARGTRIRRRRATRVAAAAVALAIVPGAIVLARQHAATLPGLKAAPASGPRFGPLRLYAPSMVSDPAAGVRTVIQTRVGASATLPQGYSPIMSLVGDQSGAGVWFWDEGGTQVKVFHLGRDGRLKSWPVLPLTESLRTGAAFGFTVTRAGTAWLAIDSTLVRLDTSTGQVRTWQIPAARANPAAARYQPPGSGSDTQVQALAVAASGQVAVADTNASSVQVLDPATGQFSQVRTPSEDDQPISVGFARNGTLGIGYQQVGAPHVSAVVIVPRRGKALVRTVTDSWAVTPYGATGLLVGATRPDVVSAAGQVSSLARPADLIGLAVSGLPVAPAPMPGNRLATVVHAGVLVFPADAASDTTAGAHALLYVPPTVRCVPYGDSAGGLTGPGHSMPSDRHAGPCHLPIQMLATDARGGLWVVDGSGDTVDLLVPR
jgi:hypothetical protein